MKFRERFMLGEVPFDEIFSLTDKWNFSDEDCTLREYLGLTAKEEDIWISDSDDALEELLEQEKRTKAVFLDLDGTLFTDAKTFSDGNRQVIEQALEAGHQIVISTGAHWQVPKCRQRNLVLSEKAVLSFLLMAVKFMICTGKKVFLKNLFPCLWYDIFSMKRTALDFIVRPTPTVRFLPNMTPKK